MVTYIAGPMAGHMGEQDYRGKIKKILKKYKLEYICPLEMDIEDLGEKETNRISEVGNGRVKHDDADIKVVRGIITRDMAAIDKCNLMIVYTPHPSYGTDMEAFYHSEINNRTTIIFSKDPKSWMLGLGDYFVDGYAALERVIKEIYKIENGDNGEYHKTA
jgi:hypothetical protein